MPRLATLVRPRVVLAGYVLVRLGLAVLLIALFGFEGMVNLLWRPEWFAVAVAVPTLAGLVGVSIGYDHRLRDLSQR